jgi:hypothetical protein
MGLLGLMKIFGKRNVLIWWLVLFVVRAVLKRRARRQTAAA